MVWASSLGFGAQGWGLGLELLIRMPAHTGLPTESRSAAVWIELPANSDGTSGFRVQGLGDWNMMGFSYHRPMRLESHPGSNSLSRNMLP